MLVDMLTKFGFFAGKNLDANHEPFFFLRLNEWLMRRAGGSWDYPLPTKYFLENEAIFNEISHLFKEALSSRWFGEYTGSYVQYVLNTDYSFPAHWGWKDPRNIFTLPVWLNIFPQAKIIYIKRNGIDVANSLVVRTNTMLEKKNSVLTDYNLFSRIKKAIIPFGMTSRVYRSSRCFDLESAYKLWEEYSEEADNLLKKISDNRKFVIRYEDFLESPNTLLKEMLSFIDIEYSENYLCEVTNCINVKRSFAFKENDKLRLFFLQKRECNQMKISGYSDIV